MSQLLIAIERHEYFALLVGTVRYALGRRSYAVGETIEIVKKYWSSLHYGQRDILIKDVSDWVFEKYQHWVPEEDQAVTREWVELQNWMLANRSL